MYECTFPTLSLDSVFRSNHVNGKERRSFKYRQDAVEATEDCKHYILRHQSEEFRRSIDRFAKEIQEKRQ